MSCNDTGWMYGKEIFDYTYRDDVGILENRESDAKEQTCHLQRVWNTISLLLR